jgi:hypothetical protein
VIILALPFIVEQLSKEKYSDPLEQNSSIFSVGTGKDENGNNIDISSSCRYGQVSDIVVKGLTATNLVKNGSFENGSNNWSNISGMVSIDTTKSYTGLKSVKQDLIDSATGPNQTINNLVVGHKYYFSSMIYISSFTSGSPRLRIRNQGINVFANTTTLNVWQRLSVIMDSTVSEEIITFEAPALSTFTAYIDAVMAIDLTATFGAGNEPTKEQCDQIFTNWFDGTKSTNSVRIRSVNEDETKESIAYVNLPQGEELRSLPNGIKDEVRVTTGVKTQNVSQPTVLSDTKMWDDGTDLGNVYRFSFANGYISTNIKQGTGRLSIDGKEWTYRIDYSGDDEHFYVGPEALIIMVSKTTVDTYAGITSVDKFKTMLNAKPITLTYQLAEPIITPIDVDGELQCFENGTIYIDPYIKKEFTYNNGITFDYPVSQIDKIKMNVSGELKEITNEVTLAPDGLSATVADISNGTVLTVYAPIRPEESTIPTTVMTYPTNTKSVIYGTHALANKNAIILDEHESMLLGLSLNYIDLANKINDLETRVTILETPETP